MADNPILDNTTAQEKQTEALQETTRGQERLSDLLRDYEAEARTLSSQQPALPVPSPRPAPPSPSPRPTPPNYGGVARRLTPEEAAQHAALQPPPLPQHVRMLQASVSAAMESLDRLRELQRAGLGTSSLAAQGERSALRAHEDFIGKQFQALTPQEQKQQLPVMQALERQRNELLEDETRKREKLNKELPKGIRAFDQFAQALSHQNVGGMLSALGPSTAGFAALASVIGQHFQMYQQSLERGGRALSPALAQSADMSDVLADMGRARREGQLGAMDELIRLRQTREAAREAGIPYGRDPGTLGGGFRQLGEAFIPGTQGNRSFTAGMSALFRTGSLAGANEAFRRSQTQIYEDFLRERGQLRPGERFKPKYDIPNLAEPGITTALGYQSELQVGALQRQDLTNQKTQEVMRVLLDMRLLLDRISGNTNGLENQGWGGPLP